MTSDPRSVTTLKEFVRHLPEHSEFRDTIRQIYGNARATAITAAAYVERTLEEYIASNLVNNDEKTRKCLFVGDSPLASFSAKIRLAYAMGLISQAIRDDLDTVREIRNAFAHSIRHADFANPEVVIVCKRLRLIPEDVKIADIGSKEQRDFCILCVTLAAMCSSAVKGDNPDAKRLLQTLDASR